MLKFFEAQKESVQTVFGLTEALEKFVVLSLVKQ